MQAHLTVAVATSRRKAHSADTPRQTLNADLRGGVPGRAHLTVAVATSRRKAHSADVPRQPLDLNLRGGVPGASAPDRGGGHLAQEGPQRGHAAARHVLPGDRRQVLQKAIAVLPAKTLGSQRARTYLTAQLLLNQSA